MPSVSTVDPAARAERRTGVPLHELKLVLARARVPALLEWLAGRCLPDPAHPAGRITSVYFDDRAHRLLRAKVNSDYLKAKVRVRWYGDERTGVPSGPAFVELKEKEGSRRYKTRVELPLSGSAYAAADLQAGVWAAALDRLRRTGVWVPLGLRPVMSISFARRRFVEPLSGARVCLDRDIRPTRGNPALLPHNRLVPLAHAVVEVKGTGQALAPWLEPLGRLGCRRESFSKYERCFRKATGRSSF